MKKVLFISVSIILVSLLMSCKKEQYKPEVFVLEKTSFFDAEIIKIDNESFDGSNNDFSTEVWFYLDSKWNLMELTHSVGGANVSTLNGDVFIVLNMSPSDNAIPIKVILKK